MIGICVLNLVFLIFFKLKVINVWFFFMWLFCFIKVLKFLFFNWIVLILIWINNFVLLFEIKFNVCFVGNSVIIVLLKGVIILFFVGLIMILFFNVLFVKVGFFVFFKDNICFLIGFVIFFFLIVVLLIIIFFLIVLFF